MCNDAILLNFFDDGGRGGGWGEDEGALSSMGWKVMKRVLLMVYRRRGAARKAGVTE